MTATMKEQHLNQEENRREKDQMVYPIVEFPIAEEFSEHILILLKFSLVLFALRSRFVFKHWSR